MDSDSTAAILMSVGAVLGLAATAPFYWFPVGFVASSAFALAFLLGFVALRRPGASRRLFAWGGFFAFLGGMSSVGMIWFLSGPAALGAFAIAFGSVGILGMTVSMVGASLGRLPEKERGRGFGDRDRLAALLICAGGAFGLIGPPTGFFFFSAFLPLVCFTVVLLLGLALLQSGPGSRVLAVITLYFALAANAFFIVFFLPVLFRYGWGADWFSFIGPMGTILAVLGAILRLHRVLPRPHSAAP